jgi:hypothetical protein
MSEKLLTMGAIAAIVREFEWVLQIARMCMVVQVSDYEPETWANYKQVVFACNSAGVSGRVFTSEKAMQVIRFNGLSCRTKSVEAEE